LDSAGRVLISPELRAAVGLEKEVMMLGMGTHFEIWDAAKLAESEAEAVAGGMPDVLSNFSF
jgi:MraZ protein